MHLKFNFLSMCYILIGDKKKTKFFTYMYKDKE